MADLNKILKEIQDEEFQLPIDIVRKKYIKKLYQITNRNVICYYSGFLSIVNHPDVAINDKDLNGFMSVIHGLDKTKGLDLIIHSPGGDVAATEAIGDYLRKFFDNDIRVFIPQIAMSGGTMLSCIGKEIYMGKHSSIGPIDPQYGGVPAYGVIQEFEQAKSEIIENPHSAVFWRTFMEKYPPAFIVQCYKAIELSSEVVENWLKEGKMFLNNSDKDKVILKVMNYLNNNQHTKVHSRHINIDKAREIGLNVIPLENDDNLQDAILSIHHCYIQTFENTRAVKIFENQNGITFTKLDI